MSTLVGEFNRLNKFPAFDHAREVPETQKRVALPHRTRGIFSNTIAASEVNKKKKKEEKETNNLGSSTKHPLLPDVRKTLQF